MSETSILVGVHGTSASGLALREAADYAARRGRRLVIATAYRPVPAYRLEAERRAAPADVWWAISPDAEAVSLLHQAAEVATELGVGQVDVRAGATSPARLLTQVAQAEHAELTVVGQAGPFRTRLLRRLDRKVPGELLVVAPPSISVVAAPGRGSVVTQPVRPLMVGGAQAV